MPKKVVSKRAIAAWCFYDWANSSFFTIVITFVFPVYFTKAVAKNTLLGTAHWGYAIALSGIIIAIFSPVFGSIADKEGRRKPWIASFTLLAIIMSALLWFIKPLPNHAAMMLSFIILGTVGIEIATIFYNAMLRDISPSPMLGRISGFAWGIGYFGGLVSLIIALFLLIKSNIFGLDTVTAQPIRICGPLVSIWILVFSLPIFIFTPDKPSSKIGLVHATWQGLSELLNTLRSLKHYKNIVIFLIAHMLYIDGLNTLFAFGGIYAAGTFDLSIEKVIELGIAMNISAGMGAIIFSWIDDHIGSKKTIFISLLCIIGLSTSLLLIHNTLWFWVLALSLSFFIGPAQASSRTLMVRIVPKKSITEMFGFYALSGKITAFIGPWLVGFLTLHFASQRIGMIPITILLFIGTLLLMLVKEA